MPKNGLLPEVKIVILVIVRWKDKGGLISEGIFQCKLVVSIKKWVDINEYKKVCLLKIGACLL